LNIEYILGDYLETPFGSDFDLISIIYCDFGVLSRKDQLRLLDKVYSSLKHGGVFVLDGYNGNLKAKLKENRDYESTESGFWRPHPYICLSERFLYEEESAFLDQHIVIDSEVKVYRFYNHYWEESQMEQLLLGAGFRDVRIGRDVVQDPDVTFYLSTK